MSTNYASELEQEFEMDDEANASYAPESDNTSESDGEYSYEVDDEFENDSVPQFESDDEQENDDEYEIDDELENDEEFESDDEFENDYAAWSRDGHYDRDREYESRLYKAIRSNTDSELQTELELDNVLHEMEQDYFFGAAKSWLKKKARKYGKFAIPGYGALKAVSALGRLNIRNLLKNKLLQTAAGFIPGAGPVISNAMRVASDVMNKADAAKERIQDIVQVGKNAYQNLAESIPDAQNEMEVREASKTAWKKAITSHAQTRDHRTPGRNKGGRTKRVFQLPPNARVAVYSTKISINRRQQVIPVKPNSIVVVKQGRLIVWETK